MFRCPHPEVVVLAYENGGQTPQRSHIERLVLLTLVRCTVSVQGDAHVGFLAVLVLERKSHAQRDLGAYNAAAAEEVVFPVVQVH